MVLQQGLLQPRRPTRSPERLLRLENANVRVTSPSAAGAARLMARASSAPVTVNWPRSPAAVTLAPPVAPMVQRAGLQLLRPFQFSAWRTGSAQLLSGCSWAALSPGPV